MAIEPKYEKVLGGERVKLGVTQAVIDCRLPVSDSSEISKILCANAKSFIVNTEIINKEVHFSGNANFQVIYENANGVANGLDYTADFKDKFISDEVNEKIIPIVVSNVVDVNTSIQNGEVKVVAIVEIGVDAIKTYEINTLVSASGENVFTSKEMLTVSKFEGVLNDKFDMSYDIEIKDNVLKVLEVTCTPYIEKVVPLNKYAKVIGGANIDICYLTNGEQNVLRTQQAKVNIDQEVALENINENTNIQSNLAINNSLIKITTNIDNDFAVVNLNLPYEYKGYAFNEYNLEVVDDIFSTDTYLSVNAQSFNSFVSGGNLNLETKVSGNVESEEQEIDEILGTCCNTVTVATAFVEDESLILEGVASTTVLYLNKENNNTYSMVVEMPFSIKETVKELKDNFTPVVSLSLGEVSAKVKRGKDVEVSATLFVYADFYSNKTDVGISEVTALEEKPETSSVLTIYVVKPNETVWEIAKSLNINPDCLLEQNPQVNLPLQGGEKLVVYRQKEILF